MAKAYVLIETGVGRTREVVNALKNIAGIQEADVVTGPYDVIAVIEGRDLQSLGDLVTEKIHAISGIIRTVTCLVTS